MLGHSIALEIELVYDGTNKKKQCSLDEVSVDIRAEAERTAARLWQHVLVDCRPRRRQSAAERQSDTSERRVPSLPRSLPL
ncbi:unnamed protein product [Boreogadus saida]